MQIISPKTGKGTRGASPRSSKGLGGKGRLVSTVKKFFGKRTMMVLSMATLAMFAYGSKDYVTGLLDRPVEGIQVTGELNYVTQAEVRKVITGAIDAHFLQLELAAVKQELENLAWIDSASVGRRWPDQLTVDIVEQKPIARWSDSGFLNQRGELVEVGLGGELDGLPLLDAAVHLQTEVMTRYQDLAILLRSRNMLITELVSDKKGSWTVALNNGLEIKMGREEAMDKMKRFLKVYDQGLHQRLAEIQSVDVRYDNGVAVQWRTPEQDLLSNQLVQK